MRMMKKALIVIALFALVLVLSSCSALSNAAKLQSYDFGSDSVPSINSIIGSRTVTGASTGTGTDGQYQEYIYNTDSAIADIQSYIDELQNQGWVITKNDGDSNAGTVQIGTESADSGKIIVVTITYTSTSYTLNVTKSVGTLNRY